MRPVLACLLLLSATPALAQPAPPHGPAPATVTMTGHGTASARPDLAILNTGVVTQAETAREALDANTAAMEKLMASLRAAAIEEGDIATSGFSVQPQFFYPQKPDGTQEAPRITGYEVRNNVSVKIRDLTKLGGMLDGVVTQGANQVDSLVFDIADKKRVLDEARRKAFDDAREKAQLYAEAAGVTLGRVRGLSEHPTGSLPAPPAPMMRSMAKAADVPVAPGEQELEAGVTASWEVAP